MEPASNLDTLHTIAQVAIAIIGFSGIVVVFGRRTGAQWSAEESLRFYVLIACPLTALACSFVPILAGQLTNDYDTIWRTSNAILGAAHLANLAPFLLNSFGAKATRGQNANAAVGVLFIASHFLAALDFLPWYAFIFILGLLQQIWIGIYNFMLLFSPEHTDA
jgi:hypothetical protein